MAIKIYTYSNPYEIDEEVDVWNEIKDSPHFCVSQTMVNGLKSKYPYLNKLQSCSPVLSLVNSLYDDWMSIETNVSQMIEVDSIINNIPTLYNNDENIKKSLAFNTSSIVKGIRLLKELGINKDNIDDNLLNQDQKTLVEIFKSVCANSDSSFDFQRIKSEDALDERIKSALSVNKKSVDFSRINLSTIVIHGVHQFTPGILCAIEDLNRYKDVVLLFNYQKQYHSVYETWLNIYSVFDVDIKFPTNSEFHPMPLLVSSYDSNVLADSLGRLSDGLVPVDNKIGNSLEVIEFDNNMEFANYVAQIYERAKRISEKKENSIPSQFMSEQFYAASYKVNDILRAYFPEQFGERHFLDYPIGHFFVAITNMWDSEKQEVVIRNFSDIKECFNSGIISESEPGILSSVFNVIEPYIEREKTISGIINKLLILYKNNKITNEIKDKIGYFNATDVQIKELINSLKEIDVIIHHLFDDFADGNDNFRRVYSRIKKLLISKVEDMDQMDDEIRGVIEKLLERLEYSDLPNTVTFTCLKNTMSYYLSQDEKLVKSARWIVRGFDQIDGDILRSDAQDPDKVTYHFCCLSDKDICSVNDDRIPWPLDIRFFEMCHPAYELKYQVFLKSKMEYQYFKRYALIYGLEFNRVNVKLSYVKNENDKANDLYHLIAALKIPVKKYLGPGSGNYQERLKIESENENQIEGFVESINDIDKDKYKLCQYKFLLEAIGQQKTVFRDRFLIHMYMRLYIVNQVKKKLSGSRYTDDDIIRTISEAFEKLDIKLKISNELEKTQLISSAYKDICYYIKNYKKKHRGVTTFPALSFDEEANIRKQAYFLLMKINDENRIIKKEDVIDTIKTRKFNHSIGSHCMYCSSKDVCMEFARMGGENW